MHACIYNSLFVCTQFMRALFLQLYIYIYVYSVEIEVDIVIERTVELFPVE